MFAVIECGGKQYKVSEGDTIYVEKLEAAEGSTVDFNALMTVNDGAVALNQGTVAAEVIKTGKQKKIMVFKYKAKKNYRRRQGHRQPYTKLVIKSVKA